MIAVAPPPPSADEPQVKTWARFFKKYYRREVNEAVLAWPKKRSLEISYDDLHRHDTKLAEELLANPREVLERAQEALKEVDVVDVHVDARPALRVRPVGLLDEDVHLIKDIRDVHAGRLIAVRGRITKRTTPSSRLIEALFQCGRCGGLVRESQEDPLRLQEPLECYEDQSGCGRDSKWKLIADAPFRGQQSKSVDYQVAEIQELPELARGDQPRRFQVIFEADLTDCAKVGRRVTLNAIVRTRPRYFQGKKTSTLEFYLEAVSVEYDDADPDDVHVDDADRAAINELARTGDPYSLCRNLLAPHIHGRDVEKDALWLALFGGVRHELPDGTSIRGDIHILLAGDPSCGKTQLLEAVSRLAPRAIYASGKATSGAGLTAAAVQDTTPGGEGRWILEAGAAVHADLGILVVDEFDKMEKNDRGHMYDVMERGRVAIHKAAAGEFLTRCAVFAGANPKDGRFTDYQPIMEQVDFPLPLLSRFDVLFILRDVPDPARDREVARRILSLNSSDSAPATDDRVETVRKWISYARGINPKLDQGAQELLADFYVEIRNARRENDAVIPLTSRQVAAAKRLTEASARVRLSPIATADDARRALAIMRASLDRYAKTADGTWDIDRIEASADHDQRSRAQILENIVAKQERNTPHGAHEDLIVSEAEKVAIPAVQARADLRMLSGRVNGPIYSERDGFYKVTRRR